MNASKISRFQRHDLRWSRSSMSSALETNRASPWYKWNERRSVQGISCSDARMCWHLLWVIMIINRLYCTIQNISTFILNSIIMILKTQPLSASQTIFPSLPAPCSATGCLHGRVRAEAVGNHGECPLPRQAAKVGPGWGWSPNSWEMTLGKNHEKQMWDLSWFIMIYHDLSQAL